MIACQQLNAILMFYDYHTFITHFLSFIYLVSFLHLNNHNIQCLSKVWGQYNVFDRILLCSPRLHLSNQKYRYNNFNIMIFCTVLSIMQLCCLIFLWKLQKYFFVQSPKEQHLFKKEVFNRVKCFCCHF